MVTELCPGLPLGLVLLGLQQHMERCWPLGAGHCRRIPASHCLWEGEEGAANRAPMLCLANCSLLMARLAHTQTGAH